MDATAPGRCTAAQRSPGLSITYASDEFLLATKLVAQRRKDASDEDSLEFILGGNDVAREVQLLAVRAERMLAKHRSESPRATPTDGAAPSAVRRWTRSTPRERD
jgi:hypothetical protein